MSTASPPQISHTLKLVDQDETLALLGPRDENLRAVEKAVDAQIVVRGESITITGVEADVSRATRFFEELLSYLRRGERLSRTTVRYLASLAREEEPEAVADVLNHAPIPLRGRRGVLRPKTRGQTAYLNAMVSDDVVFGIGPAGTGKTYLAVAMAVAALNRKQVERLILARPAVEAGESLGFLPGDLQAKVDPFLRPLYDALHDLMGGDQMRELMERGTLEIAPLAYMRGRTLNASFVILDEAQNSTPEQMKMFLTRLGVESKAVITGDVTQIDLSPKKTSGLIHSQKVLSGVEGISFVYFDKSDVVRHDLVKKIVSAYERWEKQAEDEESD